jgi:hypothetical protein
LLSLSRGSKAHWEQIERFDVRLAKKVKVSKSLDRVDESESKQFFTQAV